MNAPFDLRLDQAAFNRWLLDQKRKYEFPDVLVGREDGWAYVAGLWPRNCIRAKRAHSNLQCNTPETAEASPQ